MEAFTSLRSLVVPLDRANVDTDAIIPKQFMKSIRRTGYGDNLFDEWRYLDRSLPGQDPVGRRRNAAFTLNQERYAGALILLTRENFGCGSSREHAVWALRDFGIRVILAPSFADIFHANCFKNGVLPVTLPANRIDRLFTKVEATPGFILDIDLATQTIKEAGKETALFDIDPARKHRLLHGLDDITITLQRNDRIRAYEAQRRDLEPWLFS